MSLVYARGLDHKPMQFIQGTVHPFDDGVVVERRRERKDALARKRGNRNGKVFGPT